MTERWLSIGILLLISSGHRAQAAGPDAAPRSLDPRFKVELFAEQPQIVTPTGIDVDARGRVWAVESNTHFPPQNYQGHPTDRVLVMSDQDGDGRADRIVVFTDGLKFTMSVAVAPVWAQGPPGVYIATRREIRLFRDEDGDDRADRSERIVELETAGDYPHNGLAGFAWDALGWLYFGCGENLGANYRLVGADGTALSGGGEGGNLYRCRLDGTRLERVATGFWNPHANCCDAFGRLFSVDNDPDSRPPCRLIHAIPGGDYGYRFRNGRKGLHPFTAWNGEIPGTLPMVAGTGEAPSGVLACESDGLPADFAGNLLATSWGDHRIDRFQLKPRGASFGAVGEPLIVGGEDFRPVGLACAPDGSVYFTDWVKRDYTLHGHGRVWRISPTEPRAAPPVDIARLAKQSAPELQTHLASPRLDVRRQAAHLLSASAAGRQTLQAVLRDRQLPERSRIEALWALAGGEGGSRLDWFELGVFETCDSVAAAAGWLLQDAPQDTLQKLVETLLAERLSQRPRRLVDCTALLGLLSQCEFQPDAPLVQLAFSVDDPFLGSVLVTALARQFQPDGFARYLIPGAKSFPRLRQGMLLAARLKDPRDESLLSVALGDADPDVRRLAVQWVAEERLGSLRPRVEAVFNSNAVTADLFMATLAALEMLDGANPADIDKTPASRYVLPLLAEDGRSVAVRAQALRLVAPDDPALNLELLQKLLAGNDPMLRQEVVRTLQLAAPARAERLLLPIARDSGQKPELRADALAGLASAIRLESPGGPARRLAVQALGAADAGLRLEGLRAARGILDQDADLRGAVLKLAADIKPTAANRDWADQLVLAARGQNLELPAAVLSGRSPRPASKAEWLAELNRGRDVNPEAGRRLFFHANGPGCFKCHTVNGRGGKVGPDLSRNVESMNRIQMIQSILEPSSEIAPQFVAWTFETVDGRVLTGMLVHENEGQTIIGDAEGKLTPLKTAEIVQRVPQARSVMPDNLTELMTLQEFRDLLAFLESFR